MVPEAALLAELSVLRDGLERDVVADAFDDAASANVGIAGVEGLLARPLFVFTPDAGVDCVPRGAASLLD